jgi:nucleoid-associated protein YgaU
MGLFDFFRRDAGKKVKLDGEALKNEIKEAGYSPISYEVSVEGETVRVRGKAASQEEREKVILALGNVEGVSKVEDDVQVAATSDAPASPKADAESRFHTVEKGDTLSGIAKELYGDASKYRAIFEANRPMLKDPDRIYPGQVLRIPPAP